MPHPPRTPSPFVRRHAAFQLWLANVLVGTVVGSAWLFELPEGLSAWTRAYVALGLVSSVAVLASLPGLLFWVSDRFVAEGRALALCQAAVGNCFLGLLYTDTIIYRLLRYHFNGAVLNVALTPGAGDAVHLGWSVWGVVAVYLVLGTASQYALWRVLARALERLEARGLDLPLLLQPRTVCLLFLLPVIGIEKSVYAAAHAQGDHELISASSPLPLYPRLRLGRWLGPEHSSLPTLPLAPEGSSLAYPRALPELPPDGPRPNLLVVVLDSWRRDMFTPELTPNLWEFAAHGRVFEDHLSGGNGTRYGLFTMLYGLHGSYWTQALARRQPPALVECLTAAGYDLRVFSAASMNFPEFLDTAWSTLPREHVVDEFLDERGEPRSHLSYVKDGFVAEAFDSWLSERQRSGARRPFFGFVLLDAPHQPYDSPGGPYRPTIDELNYIELGRTRGGPELAALVERVRNSYKNSVVHADGTALRLIRSLERWGALDDTVVVVTGDHGEEFQENGYWGHTSNFSPQQVEVPFVLRGPGVVPGREPRPTSHLDVSNSLLELLGADPGARADYSLGESLFAPPATRARAIAGWSDVGLWTDSGIFQLPLDVDADEIWVYDRQWRPLADVSERCAAERGALERMSEECSRFLVPTGEH